MQFLSIFNVVKIESNIRAHALMYDPLYKMTMKHEMGRFFFLLIAYI